jgi:general secretion pathway protein K
MTTRHASHPQGQRGIALILVLWMLTLLTVMASGFVYATRTELGLSGTRLALARAEAAADGAVFRALYEMIQPAADANLVWRTDGRTYPVDLPDARVEVSIQEESARIDLNAAPEALLRGLLLSTGVSAEEAESLLDAILDWRDADDLVRTRGAEHGEYAAAGLGHAPANANFQTVDELRLVMGMTPELYKRLAGALTVYSGQSGINSAVAPRDVLLALPGATSEDVDAYIDARAAYLAENLAPPVYPPASGFTSAGTTSVYNFRARATLPDNTFFIREAVARVTRDRQRPFLFLDWKEGTP